MNFIKNITRKFIKEVPAATPKNVTFSQEDIGLLAYMCLICRPLSVEGLFGKNKNVYSYYIPHDSDNINLAQKLFTRNGIETEELKTRMISSEGMPSLRIQLNSQYETDDRYRFMCAVNDRFCNQTRQEYLCLKSLYNSIKTKEK